MNGLDTIAMASLSRRLLLGGAGAAAVTMTLAQRDFLRAAAAQDEAVQNILDITATVERFGVTFLGEGLQRAEDGRFDMPWPPVVVAIVTAARAQEQFHLDFFEQAGGVPLVDSFTVPPEFLTDFNAFFTAVVEQETAETAAQIAAMRTFAELGRPDLAKVSFQYAAEESEHRLVANYTRGVRPPNDNAFAPALFATIDEFLASLEARGIIGGDGVEIVFPGPGEIDATNVTNTEPGGVEVSCAPGDGAAADGVGAGDVAQIDEAQGSGDDGGRGGGGRSGGDGQGGGGGRGGRGGGDDQVNGMPAVGVGGAYGAAGSSGGVWAMLGLAGAAGAAALTLRTRRPEPLALDDGGDTSGPHA